MTAAKHAPELVRIAEHTRHMLLDFDGPICKVFTDPTARTVTAQLTALMNAQGIDVPTGVQAKAGPHDLLYFAATVSTQLARTVEGTLRAIEIDAIAKATPTPGVEELLQACEQTGRSVAVVSNNAGEAVKAYLARRGLTEPVSHIEGRDPRNASLMKPDTYLIDQALCALDTNAAACALVGDSVTDIEGAHAAGSRSIGYANKPGKRERLDEAGADAVVDSMADLAGVLSAHPARALPN